MKFLLTISAFTCFFFFFHSFFQILSAALLLLQHLRTFGQILCIYV